MLIDTHCHINMMTKKNFDVLMHEDEFNVARNIIDDAKKNDVSLIINVGTSLPESQNCVALAKCFENIYAAVGIHPNDLTEHWQSDFAEIKSLVAKKAENKIVSIGECGIDMYREYNLQRQKDGLKAQIELALENDLALIVHSRSAPQETLQALDEYHKEIKRCVIHCFSEGFDFAKQAIDWGFYLGIGGTITYPKNDLLRNIAKSINLKDIVLETDAPFLPLQANRGKQNAPKYIKNIAQYIAELKNVSFDEVANITTFNAKRLFKI
jgi:TatD DNase family protein